MFDLGIAVPGFGISGEQSRIQKLHCIQKLVFRNYFVVFRNYFVVFRNYFVIFRNYFVVFRNYFVVFRNYFVVFRNYFRRIQKLFSSYSETTVPHAQKLLFPN